MYDILRIFSCIIRVFYFLYCFLLFICVRLSRDLKNATYFATYLILLLCVINRCMYLLR